MNIAITDEQIVNKIYVLWGHKVMPVCRQAGWTEIWLIYTV